MSKSYRKLPKALERELEALIPPRRPVRKPVKADEPVWIDWTKCRTVFDSPEYRAAQARLKAEGKFPWPVVANPGPGLGGWCK